MYATAKPRAMKESGSLTIIAGQMNLKMSIQPDLLFFPLLYTFRSLFFPSFILCTGLCHPMTARDN